MSYYIKKMGMACHHWQRHFRHYKRLLMKLIIALDFGRITRRSINTFAAQDKYYHLPLPG